MNPSQGKGTVLVADDDVAILKLTIKVLELVGYAPLTAIDFEQTVAALRSPEHDVRALLLDLHMPGMHGRPTVEELLELRPDVPMLIISGQKEDETRKQLGELDFAFLEKPFAIPELIAKLQELVR